MEEFALASSPLTAAFIGQFDQDSPERLEVAQWMTGCVMAHVRGQFELADTDSQGLADNLAALESGAGVTLTEWTVPDVWTAGNERFETFMVMQSDDFTFVFFPEEAFEASTILNSLAE